MAHISSTLLGLFSKIHEFRAFHISHIEKPGRSSHILFTILFLKKFLGHSVMVASSLPLCLCFFFQIVTPLSQMAFATEHSSSRWLINSPFISHRQHLIGPLIPLVWMFSHVSMCLLRRIQQKFATFEYISITLNHANYDQ